MRCSTELTLTLTLTLTLIIIGVFEALDLEKEGEVDAELLQGSTVIAAPPKHRPRL